MRLMKFEILKYIKDKFVLGILCFLLFLSVILSLVTCYNSDINPVKYSELHKITDNLSIEEAKDYIKDQKLYFQFYDEYCIANNKNDIVTMYQNNYGEEWIKKSLLKCSNTDENEIFSNLKVLDRLEMEIKSIESYPNLRKQFVEQSEQNKSISIFNDKKINNKNNKIMDAYNNVDPQMTLKLVPSLGIEQLISLSFLDLFCIVFVIYIIGVFIYQERRRGFQAFTQTMVDGNKKQFFVKLSILIFFSAICIVLEYFVSILTISIVYGGLPIQATIQEIPLFIKSIINGNIMYMLIIFCIQKILAIAIIAIIVYITAQFLESYITLILFMLSLLVISYLCYSEIGSLSVLSIFKYLNLYAILQSMNYIGDYICINLFNSSVPISINQLFIIAVLFVLILLILTSSIKIYHVKLKKTRKKDKRLKTHSLFFYECKKVWFKDYGLLLICIMIGIQSIFLFNYKPYITMDDIYYNYFIDNIGNQVTQDSQHKLTEMTKYYDSLLEDKVNTQSIDYANVDNLKRYPAFEKYNQNYIHLKKVEGGELLKENEYRLLFSDNIVYRMVFLFTLFGMLFFIGRSFNREKETGVDMIQHICINGGKKLWHIKIYSLLTITIPLNIFMYATIILKNQTLFPSLKYLSDINNLYLSGDFGCKISIGLYLVLAMITINIMLMSMVVMLSYFTMKSNRKHVVTLVMVLTCMICFVLEEITHNSILNFLYFFINVFCYPHFMILLMSFCCSLFLGIYYWHKGESL